MAIKRTTIKILDRLFYKQGTVIQNLGKNEKHDSYMFILH